LTVLFSVVSAPDAHADKRTKKKIKNKLSEAMEYYDLLEYEEARKHLSQALTMAKKADMEEDSIVAEVHLHLGIVYFAGLEDPESAKLSFINAVEIDSSVQIDASYKTDDMDKLLAAAKKEFGGKTKPPKGDDDDDDDGGDDVDCDSLTGILHTLVDDAKAGSDRSVNAHVSAELGAAKVSLHYRPQGASEFSEIKMKKQGGCNFVADIPSKAIRGDFLHYYVSAYNDEGKAVASKGSAGSPNIIEVIASSGGGDDENPLGMDENPLSGGGGNNNNNNSDDDDDDDGGGVSGTVPGKKKPAKLFISIAAGTGAGFVNGETEQTMNEVGCCLAPALLHLFPELGYYLSERSSISAAFRAGFVVGADRAGHATFAPAAVMRYRYALDPKGEGLQVSGEIGGGLIRHTVKLADPDGMGDTDTTASGPLLIGGGVGYIKSMGGAIRFIAEVNALAGIPIISELGTCPGQGCIEPNFAVQFDLNLGLIFAF
jgi:hypothetical protein